MSEARELLRKHLTPELYEKADLYLELYPNLELYPMHYDSNMRADNIQEALDCFIWDDTDEGFEFWSEIWESYENQM
jgi:hypothetical protein